MCEAWLRYVSVHCADVLVPNCICLSVISQVVEGDGGL